MSKPVVDGHSPRAYGIERAVAESVIPRPAERRRQTLLHQALEDRYADDRALARPFGYGVTPASSVTAWRARRLARSQR